jgi:hypothetical protein
MPKEKKWPKIVGGIFGGILELVWAQDKTSNILPLK